MGVNISDIVSSEKIDLKALRGRMVAIDAYNAIYQFLSVIRQPDGTPLCDQRGRVTSHLTGLLYRNANFMELGIRPAYVFDGVPPLKKHKTIAERGERRAKAKKDWEDSVAKGDYKAAYAKATQSSKITNEIVESSRILLTYLGMPVIQAPEEGEAQAAYMALKGDVWAASSQDFDSLLFGAPRLIRNLTLTGKRKMPGRDVAKEINVEVVELQQVLSETKLTREQLIDLCILVGTDFNEGIMGIGPKKGLKLIREQGGLEGAFKLLQVEIDDYQELRHIFLDFERTDDYKLVWQPPNEEKVIEFLCGQYDFSQARVEAALRRYVSKPDERGRGVPLTQRSLDVF
jgi:flap endonuclease-1